MSYSLYKVSIRYLKKKFPRWRADSSPGPKNINNFSLLPVQHSIKKTFFKAKKSMIRRYENMNFLLTKNGYRYVEFVNRNKFNR